MSTQNDTNFLSDLTDGREKGDWKTRYEEDAQTQIRKEKKCLLILFFVVIIISGVLAVLCKLESVFDESLLTFKPYVFGALGGALGGTIFSTKWLIHSVAKNTWNVDRQIWRLLTPLISTSIAIVIVALFNSDIVHSSSFEPWSIHKSFGIGFLSGYFSDNAIGKLTELAQVLFGSNTKGG